MAEWPSTVPYKPVGNSLRVKPFREPYRTEMEDGPPFMRPSSTLAIATLEFQLLMTAAELSSFEDWVRLSLNYGTLRFDMMVWKSGSFTERVCSFVEPYQITATVDDIHTVQIKIEAFGY